MIDNQRISLNRLILSLSEALDYVCPSIADHQQRVTYIALQMARQMGWTKRNLLDLFLAAALHDIGLIRVEKRIQFLRYGDLESVARHGETGYELLRNNELYAKAARIIRFHHLRWNDGQGARRHGGEVPFASHLIVLADWVDRSIRRDCHILAQCGGLTRRVVSRSGGTFHPDGVSAFEKVACREAFWLNITSRQIDDLLLRDMEEIPVDPVHHSIQNLMEVFAHVVDALSRWTATHTAGVAAAAVALAKRMGFSIREQIYMRTAGLLHDLGKLSVPTRILDQKDKLSGHDWAVLKSHTYHTYRILESMGMPKTIVEWASFHHERMDGRGYPFHLTGQDLTLGSRIMAVADIFTALLEDRPYRRGLSKEKALAALSRMAKTGALDGRVVAALITDYDRIDEVRRREQARYTERRELLNELASPGAAGRGAAETGGYGSPEFPGQAGAMGGPLSPETSTKLGMAGGISPPEPAAKLGG